MTWEQKLQALNRLTGNPAAIYLRRAGNWYVSIPGVNRREGVILSSGSVSAGSPESAVNDYWDWATDPRFYLEVGPVIKEPRRVRWNGFMWEDVGVK